MARSKGKLQQQPGDFKTMKRKLKPISHSSSLDFRHTKQRNAAAGREPGMEIYKNKNRRNAICIPQSDLDKEPLTEMLKFKSELRVPAHVFDALYSIEQKKNARDKDSVARQLLEIKHRVTNALLLSGMEDFEGDDFSSDNYVPPAIQEAKQKREEAARQAELLNSIEAYLETTSARKALITEVGDWLEFSSADTGEDFVSEEEADAQVAVYDAMNRDFSKAWRYSRSLVEKIKNLSNILLKEISPAPEEEPSEPSDLFGGVFLPREKPKPVSKERGGERGAEKSVLDESQISNKFENFQTACSQVFQAMDQSVRHVRKNAQKNVLRNGVKQFRFLIKAMERRITEAKQLEENRVALNMKIDMLTKTVNKLKQDKSKQDIVINSLDAKIAKLEADIKKLSDAKSLLQQKLSASLKQVEDLNSEIETLHSTQAQLIMEAREEAKREAEIEYEMMGPERKGSKKMTRFETPEVPTTTPVPIVPPTIDVDSIVNAATFPLQDKLMETEGLLANAEEDRKVLRHKLKVDEERIAALEAQVESMAAEAEEHKKKEEVAKRNEKSRMVPERAESLYKVQNIQEENESLERQITRLLSELKCKDELIEYQESRISAMREELGSLDVELKEGKKEEESSKHKAKKLVDRLQKVHDVEINRFKAYLEKERARYEAVKRKIERSHKEHLGSIHKQSLHLLRAINRFKETVALMFEREKLPLAAHDIRRVPNLPTEECPEDAKLMLAQMAGGAVELLVTVEFKISQVLMNKRLEMKNQKIALNFASKDLQSQVEIAAKAKLAAETMTGKFKDMTVKLAQANESIRQFKALEVQLAASSERYRQLMQQYTNLQRGMAKLRQGFEDSLRKKEKELLLSRSERSKMERFFEEQQAIIDKLEQDANKLKMERKSNQQMALMEAHANLTLLRDAYEDKKISQEMFATCSELLTQRIQWPLLRLRHLVHNYKRFRDLLAAREDLEDELHERLVDREPERRTILSRIDASLTQRIRDWQDTRARLHKKRSQIIKKINIVLCDYLIENEISAEVSLPPKPIVLPPIATAQKAPTTILDDQPTLVQNLATKRRLGATQKPKTRVVLPKIPSKVMGVQMPLLTGSRPDWKLPVLSSIDAKATTPQILQLDINQHLRMAERALRKANRKLVLPMKTVYGCVYSSVKVNDISCGADEVDRVTYP